MPVRRSRQRGCGRTWGCCWGASAVSGLIAAARLRFSRAVGWLLLALYAVYITYEVLTVWVFDVIGTRGA